MRRFYAALLFSALLLTLSVQGQNTKLGVKLGPNEAAWQVAPYQGKLDAVAINADGRPASAVGPNGLVLTTTAAIAGPPPLKGTCTISTPAAALSSSIVRCEELPLPTEA